ncbi:hypothetical protein IQ218_02655 [Synechocystis salina LEGE 06099]|uniref:KGK domain-containing protein n=1 Tax=Synechocystis salina TaxID=945780 RepID=UPI0018824027|nr:KGK domain-containing protein [Synechocystis salina]MBE9202567.1 hypothetical protein [Synechocystis salina LEGE 06099]
MKFEISNNLKKVDEKSVIKCDNQLEIYALGKISKILGEFFADAVLIASIVEKFKTIRNGINMNRNIFEDGIQCEILGTNYPDWVRGKLIAKVVLEFIPEEQSESESPLDEIRREMQNN